MNFCILISCMGKRSLGGCIQVRVVQYKFIKQKNNSQEVSQLSPEISNYILIINYQRLREFSEDFHGTLSAD